MNIFKTNRTDWENKHETFVEKIKDLYIVANETSLNALDSYIDSTKGFQSIIRDSINNNIPIRCLGAGWSWTRIATATNGLMLDTKQLNTTMTISAESVLSTYTGDIKKLLFAQCGNGIWELSRELKPKQLSLKTSGASNGQTIAGAMSTGAHGSAFDFGAVQDFVVFNAALVSFGSFGIIHGVMIETEDLFLLECYMKRMPYDDSLKHIMHTLDFSNANLPCGNERPYHFQVNINPYDLENGAYVYSFYKRPYRDNYIPHLTNEAGIGPGDDAACFVGRLTQEIPALVPTIVNKLLAGALKPFDKVFGILGEIFDNTTLHGKLLSAAIGISIDDVNRVVDLLLEMIKTKGPFACLFSFRFVKKTKATLGFTHFDHTCVFEMDGVFSDETSRFFGEVWNKLDEENIAYTTHWGKMSELDFQKINKMYGDDNVDAWIEARNKLLDIDNLKVFTNPILKQWGFDKVLV